MSRIADYLIGIAQEAGLPAGFENVAMIAGEQIKTYDREPFLAEIRVRISRACDGWEHCNPDALCDGCPLTDMRDEASDECEHGEEVPS